MVVAPRLSTVNDGGADRPYSWSNVARSEAILGSLYASTIAIVSPAPVPVTVPPENEIRLMP